MRAKDLGYKTKAPWLSSSVLDANVPEEVLTMTDMEEEAPVAEEKTKEASKTEPTQRTVRRVRRPCPIPECKGALFKNMWNHIFQTHKKQGRYTSKLS